MCYCMWIRLGFDFVLLDLLSVLLDAMKCFWECTAIGIGLMK